MDAALDDYVTTDHLVDLIHSAIPPVRGRITGNALVEVTDPAFLRRATAAGIDPPINPPAALAPWVREVLTALDRLLAGQLPDVPEGHWWAGNNGLAAKASPTGSGPSAGRRRPSFEPDC